ncbi:MAG: hypothetical protein V3V49_02105 [Candidatus Krumholzibacteria bacterium]
MNSRLEWEAHDAESDPVTYDIYFGQEPDPPLVESGHAEPHYDLPTLEYATTYYWKIVARTTQHKPVSGAVWQFTTIANKTPTVPASPLPFDGITEQPVDITLSWFASDPEGASLTFDVHLGTDADPPLEYTDLSQNHYKPARLEFQAIYYWRIVARDDSHNETSGPVWRFTTVTNLPPGIPNNPSPRNGDDTQPLDVTLGWRASDPENDPLTYDVYFGTSNDPPLVASDRATESYAPGPLEIAATYYWKVTVKDDHNHAASGPLWNFSTVNGMWTEMTSGTNQNLRGVWAGSPSSVFAVGGAGVIRHFNGVSWNVMVAGTRENLEAVWGSSTNDVFAVGTRGTILHYDGFSWVAQSSGTFGTLLGVWGSSASDVFAVGESNLIRHYDGTRWLSMISGSNQIQRGVWGASASSVFSVGTAGTILRYDGSVWRSMDSPNATPTLFGVWGSSASDVFAVGWRGNVLRYDGAEWSPMASGTTNPLNAVWGSSANDVFAVGSSGIILHHSGTGWIAMASGTTRHLYGISGNSKSDVFAVGDFGVILHFASQ